MPEQDQPLRPRFKIERRRIKSEHSEPGEADFSPDKVVYIEIDDEITNVFDRLKRIRGKKIAIVIPKRAVLLQSIVNLKILKKKIDELEKDVVIVTSDLPGLQLAEKAGMQAVSRLFEHEEAAEPKQQASFRQRPMRISGEKVSISEVIRTQKPSFLAGFIGRMKERLKKKKQEKSTRLVFIAPNKQALFTLVLVSILLLLAIAYIALPGATIAITPKSSVLDPTFNVTFLDYDKNRDLLENSINNNILIASFPVNPPPFTKKFTHSATGKTFQGANAEGTITVTNLSNNPWDLAPKTRFQTGDGLIFRTAQQVRVPPARGSVPGTLDVHVIADEVDAQGEVIGARGNIPPTKFSIPGIKNEENKKKLYGISSVAMTGGITQTIKSVRKEDIEAVTGEIKREIAKGAIEDLKAYLEQQNLIKKTNLSLLTDRNVIKISDPEIVLPADVNGKPIPQFEVTATYTLSGIAFDRQQLISTLKERLMTRVDPDKKIIKISEDDISYKFLDRDDVAGKARLTATIRAIQLYELDPEQENGHRFIKKITDHILGMSVKDAKDYLEQQTDEISRVDITTWPVWAPTIPNIADNVKFVIKDQNDLQ